MKRILTVEDIKSTAEFAKKVEKSYLEKYFKEFPELFSKNTILPVFKAPANQYSKEQDPQKARKHHQNQQHSQRGGNKNNLPIPVFQRQGEGKKEQNSQMKTEQSNTKGMRNKLDNMFMEETVVKTKEKDARKMQEVTVLDDDNKKAKSRQVKNGEKPGKADDLQKPVNTEVKSSSRPQVKTKEPESEDNEDQDQSDDDEQGFNESFDEELEGEEDPTHLNYDENFYAQDPYLSRYPPQVIQSLNGPPEGYYSHPSYRAYEQYDHPQSERYPQGYPGAIHPPYEHQPVHQYDEYGYDRHAPINPYAQHPDPRYYQNPPHLAKGYRQPLEHYIQNPEINVLSEDNQHRMYAIDQDEHTIQPIESDSPVTDDQAAKKSKAKKKKTKASKQKEFEEEIPQEMYNYYGGQVDQRNYHDPYYAPNGQYERHQPDRHYPHDPREDPSVHYQVSYPDHGPHYGRYADDQYHPGGYHQPRDPRTAHNREIYYTQQYSAHYPNDPRNYQYYRNHPDSHEEFGGYPPHQYAPDNARFQEEGEGYYGYNHQYMQPEAEAQQESQSKASSKARKDSKSKRAIEKEVDQSIPDYIQQNEEAHYYGSHPHVQHTKLAQKPDSIEQNASTTASQVRSPNIQSDVKESDQSSSQQGANQSVNTAQNEDTPKDQSNLSGAQKKPTTKLRLSKMNPKAQEFHQFDPELLEHYIPHQNPQDFQDPSLGHIQRYPNYVQDDPTVPIDGVSYYPGVPDPSADPRMFYSNQRHPVYLNENREPPIGPPYPIQGGPDQHEMGYYQGNLPPFDPNFDPAYLHAAALNMMDPLSQKQGMSKTQKRKMKKKQKMMGLASETLIVQHITSEQQQNHQVPSNAKNPQKSAPQQQQKQKNPQNPNQKKKGQEGNAREPLNHINSYRGDDSYQQGYSNQGKQKGPKQSQQDGYYVQGNADQGHYFNNPNGQMRQQIQANNSKNKNPTTKNKNSKPKNQPQKGMNFQNQFQQGYGGQVNAFQNYYYDQEVDYQNYPQLPQPNHHSQAQSFPDNKGHGQKQESNDRAESQNYYDQNEQLNFSSRELKQILVIVIYLDSLRNIIKKNCESLC